MMLRLIEKHCQNVFSGDQKPTFFDHYEGCDSICFSQSTPPTQAQGSASTVNAIGYQ